MQSLADTEHFMRAAGQDIPDAPKQPHLDVATLRLSLILEELTELADALGLRWTFNRMLAKSMEAEAENTYHYDPVAVLDALADLRVVCDGAVLACGLQGVFPAALAEVHRSNMSKFPHGILSARNTIEHYAKQGVEAVAIDRGEVGYIILRKSDGKILKSLHYSPANLAPLLP